MCPLGALVYDLSNKAKMARAVLVSLAVSLAFETVQLFTAIGGFGIKDVVANAVGGFLGACLMALIGGIDLEKKHTKALMTGVILASVGLLAYLVRNTLMHWDVYVAILTGTL